MRFGLALLSFFFLLSCNEDKVKPEATPSPGDEHAFQPVVVDATDALRLKVLEVCSALEEKEMNLDDYVIRGNTLRVTYQESDCDGNISEARSMDVAIQEKYNRHIFVAENGHFGLPEVETLNSGVMKEICTALQLPMMKNPLETASGMAIEFRLAQTSTCPMDSQHVCLLVTKGKINPERTSYRVNLSTLISFETSRGSRPGFYAYKNEKTFGSCGNKKYRTKAARF